MLSERTLSCSFQFRWYETKHWAMSMRKLPAYIFFCVPKILCVFSYFPASFIETLNVLKPNKYQNPNEGRWFGAPFVQCCLLSVGQFVCNGSWKCASHKTHRPCDAFHYHNFITLPKSQFSPFNRSIWIFISTFMLLRLLPLIQCAGEQLLALSRYCLPFVRQMQRMPQISIKIKWLHQNSICDSI